MKGESLTDRDLRSAVSEMQQGLLDARLGGSLFKKRVARAGQGKRGGYRVIVAGNFAGRWLFLFGFAKNERDNIDDEELRLMKRIAAALLDMSAAKLSEALAAGELMEIKNGEKTVAHRTL